MFDTIDNLLLAMDRTPSEMHPSEQDAAQVISEAWRLLRTVNQTEHVRTREEASDHLRRLCTLAAVPYYRPTLRAIDIIMAEADAKGFRYDSGLK